MANAERAEKWGDIINDKVINPILDSLEVVPILDSPEVDSPSKESIKLDVSNIQMTEMLWLDLITKISHRMKIARPSDRSIKNFIGTWHRCLENKTGRKIALHNTLTAKINPTEQCIYFFGNF